MSAYLDGFLFALDHHRASRLSSSALVHLAITSFIYSISGYLSSVLRRRYTLVLSGFSSYFSLSNSAQLQTQQIYIPNELVGRIISEGGSKINEWGPRNGYVYQKAYLEFFVNPALLTLLLSHIERDSNITYYVINKRGDLRTNTHSDGPNAVTWGVFPKSGIRPTYHCRGGQLHGQWARIYDADSPSAKIISELMDTCYLPFFQAEEEYAASQANAPNGHYHCFLDFPMADSALERGCDVCDSADADKSSALNI
ncbi:hypothetical protein BT96DRAFT_1002529 [Gymnopus androsaceus JB14]|uniref:MTHFR SAM-binding regulatory domain-containing protein n=1 Tax=Gymnopus androsaceus JB14 TaxID=1447944 RepID=A0A6A4GYS2_9AGAR|nr:hypothetical protein BT96DRAFT_1002529 [Gymnopus androsaceus JB14]